MEYSYKLNFFQTKYVSVCVWGEGMRVDQVFFILPNTLFCWYFLSLSLFVCVFVCITWIINDK